jgi:hypothetical protein
MKKKILTAFFCAVVLALGLGGAVALADWGSTQYAYQSHSIGLSAGWGDEGSMTHWDEWQLYWDSGQGRYTQYKVLSSSFGYVEVADVPNTTVIKNEQAQLYDYQDSLVVSHGWSDIVNKGYWWSENFPATDRTTTKPTGSDATRIDWYFIWSRVKPCGNPLDGMEFYFTDSSFQYYYGCTY